MALERPPIPASLLAHIRRRRALETALRKALPEDLASHVFLLNVRGGTLVMGCDSQAMITPLRFQAPALLEAAREVLDETRPLRVAWRTMPPPAGREEAHAARRPSHETAEGIAAAASCVEDEALRQALNDLAQTLDKGRK